jgi:hypothetical protein
MTEPRFSAILFARLRNLAVLGLLLQACSGWAIAKVYLISGDTRVGAVLSRDGRITVTMPDRLFQHPEENVHRIDHVTGETTLVSGDNVFIREKPEPFAPNLVAVPKGCEVGILGYEGEWTQVEVYAGRDYAKGYIENANLSDSVLFNPADPRVRFKDPAPPLRDRYMLGKESISLQQAVPPAYNETSFQAPAPVVVPEGGVLDLVENETDMNPVTVRDQDVDSGIAEPPAPEVQNASPEE